MICKETILQLTVSFTMHLFDEDDLNEVIDKYFDLKRNHPVVEWTQKLIVR